MKYYVILQLENFKIVTWTGKADNLLHAEGLAIAKKTEQHKQQVFQTLYVGINNKG